MEAKSDCNNIIGSHIFGNNYSDIYDALYKDKDYEGECNFIEEIFRRYSSTFPIKNILDLGCGTGNHLNILASRGYGLTGVDISPYMLEKARHKAAAKVNDFSSNLPRFLQGDVRSVTVDRKFDAVLMMFVVLGYQTTHNDVMATFRNARRHLTEDGIFLFDFWFGPAVLSIRPSDRVKVIKTPSGQLVRYASGSLDVYHNIADICFHMWFLSNKTPIEETKEIHKVRYFFPQEIDFYLKCSGFELIAISAFPNIDQPVDESTWNVAAIAKAI